jgi:hypothetical protein
MVRLGPAVAVLVAALTLVLRAPASAQIAKHSGSLLDVDHDRGTITLAELGPWRLETETTVVMVHTIVVTPETDFAVVRRVAGAPGATAQELVLEDVEPWLVSVGDSVTVDCVRRAGRLIARRIVVTEAAVR